MNYSAASCGVSKHKHVERNCRVGEGASADTHSGERWAVAGLPFEVAEIGIGHKLRGIAGRYINLSDEQIRGAFREMFEKMATRWQQEKIDVAP